MKQNANFAACSLESHRTDRKFSHESHVGLSYCSCNKPPNSIALSITPRYFRFVSKRKWVNRIMKQTKNSTKGSSKAINLLFEHNVYYNQNWIAVCVCGIYNEVRILNYYPIIFYILYLSESCHVIAIKRKTHKN